MIRDKIHITDNVIDLTGPDGNSFVLLSRAKNLCKQLSIDFNEFYSLATEGDYENLISVFDNYFGDYVILER